MWRLMCASLALLICVKGDSLSQQSDFGHPFLNPRIVGGVDTHVRSWPWMVSLHAHFCGGSLITDEWVLTAAHCVKGMGKSSLRAHLGKTTQEGNDPNAVIMEVTDIIIHPLYNEKTFDNDIALLHLSSTVVLNEYIKPVSLAAENSDFAPKTKSWITGWGRINENDPLPPPGILRETTVEVFDDSQCHKLCGGITKNMICAGLSIGGSGHFKGDSGGPMVNRWCSSWVQSGVISWTVGCAEPNKPDGYTRVSKYQQWITDKIHKNLPGFVLFPPGPCFATSQTSTSCKGRCNEKSDAGNACNCHVACEPNCCKDYNHQCLS